MNTVEFPKLGLSFQIDRVAFKVFGVEIYWYAIIILIGFSLAVFLAVKNSKKFGFQPEDIMDLALFGAVFGFICARLYYVVFNWEIYRDDPMKALNFREGGIALYGALIGALVTAYFLARFKKLSPFKLIDFVIPYFVLAQAIGRWGNFINQEAFGVNTTLPWGMTGDGIQRQLEKKIVDFPGIDPSLPVHPTFLYESLWNLGVFFLLLWFRKKKKLDGEVALLYLIAYGLGRAWIEALRTDSLMLGNTGIRVSLLLSLIFVLLCSVAFFVRRRKTAVLADIEAAAISTGYEGILKELRQETTEPGDVLELSDSEKTGQNTDKEENANKEEKMDQE